MMEQKVFEFDYNDLEKTTTAKTIIGHLNTN